MPDGNNDMDESLRIECEWWGPAYGEKCISEVSRAAIGLCVGEQWLTRLEDSWGNTVRNRLNACAYTLAGWFAANWWRLRWEPETPASRKDVDWRMSHSMASAGGGFCWPSILFASDGESIAVASQASRGRILGPVRYLNEVKARISAKEFERAIDVFLSLVLSRLQSEGYRKSDLAELWDDVMKERGDPALAQWRRLEAICGFDPGEAPSAVIEMLVADAAGLGSKALEEVAAEGRHSVQNVLEPILDLAASNERPLGGGFRGKMPELPSKPRYEAHMRPWQQASKLAQLVRKQWGLGEEAISDKQLADFLGTKASVFSDRTKGPTSMPVALQSVTHDGRFDFYFHSAWATSRRFSAARLLGDYLHQARDGRLIPATRARTSRQQFQRAFAQEFLCPFKALVARIQTDQPDEEDIAEAADFFGVSSLMVKTTLVNRGELDREALVWDN